MPCRFAGLRPSATCRSRASKGRYPFSILPPWQLSLPLLLPLDHRPPAEGAGVVAGWSTAIDSASACCSSASSSMASMAMPSASAGAAAGRRERGPVAVAGSGSGCTSFAQRQQEEVSVRG